MMSLKKKFIIFFSECGAVSDIRWPKGEFNGYGWIEFKDTNSVDEAIKLKGKFIKGRPVKIDFAKSKF